MNRADAARVRRLWPQRLGPAPQLRMRIRRRCAPRANATPSIAAVTRRSVGGAFCRAGVDFPCLIQF